MGSKSKRRRSEDRITELRKLCEAAGYPVQAFSHIHFRVHGPTRVDYWPGTSRAWIVDSAHKGRVVEPSEVVQLASYEPLPQEQPMLEGAESHMRSLQ